VLDIESFARMQIPLGTHQFISKYYPVLTHLMYHQAKALLQHKLCLQRNKTDWSDTRTHRWA